MDVCVVLCSIFTVNQRAGIRSSKASSMQEQIWKLNSKYVRQFCNSNTRKGKEQSIFIVIETFLHNIFHAYVRTHEKREEKEQ
jgi:hypothetical protein